MQAAGCSLQHSALSSQLSALSSQLSALSSQLSAVGKIAILLQPDSTECCGWPPRTLASMVYV
jgi:hypothetical protein